MAEHSIDRALRYIESRRLLLLAASVDLVDADIAGRADLAKALALPVPENWPPELFDRPAMEFARRELLETANHGWSFWYIVYKSGNDKARGGRQLIGIGGFKGRPDGSGSVEIGYSILPQFRNQGLATEAVSRLVEWAFTHRGVQEVCAETLPYLRQSIRVLEKNGFELTGPGSEHGVVRYAVFRRRNR